MKTHFIVKINSNLLLGILFLALSSIATNSLAQDSSFDELSLNGLASFVRLRKEYYIGGLYLEILNQDTGSVINMSGKKRMEIRITIDKWSPRRFTQQWNQAILINNDQESQEEFADQILKFTDMPKHELIAGDRIVINMDPSKGTTVYLNDQQMLKTTNNAFFDVLLSTWIGQRPPSSNFRNDILTLPTDQAGTDLLARYATITPTASRKKKIAAWMQPTKSKTTTKAKAVAAKATASEPAGFLPPSSDTTVTAKRANKTTPKAKVPTAIVQPKIVAPKIAAPKPSITLDKSSLTSNLVKKPKPTAKQVKKPAPEKTATAAESAPKKVAKPAKPQVAAAEKEQKALLKTYRSNLIKLTLLNSAYPKRAMRLKQEGLVVLNVKVNRQGKLLDIVEERTSEHPLLNKAAQKAVKKTAPYPEIPRDLIGEEITVSLPFNFKL
ncbi:MAG: TonB family protein [Pseudomonadales bacterium]